MSEPGCTAGGVLNVGGSARRSSAGAALVPASLAVALDTATCLPPDRPHVYLMHTPMSIVRNEQARASDLGGLVAHA